LIFLPSGVSLKQISEIWDVFQAKNYQLFNLMCLILHAKCFFFFLVGEGISWVWE